MKIAQRDLARLQDLVDIFLVDLTDLDGFIAGTPHIFRSIKGHAFEVWFDRVVEELGYRIEKAGGDSVIDRKINGHSLQLKTPYARATITGKTVGFRMHKTHGPEVFPQALYKKAEFPDFLVGLHPDAGVIICQKEKLPTRRDVNPKLMYGSYIANPLPFPWGSEWLNRYDLLDIKLSSPPLPYNFSTKPVLFPNTISKIGFTDYDIVHAILDPSNFRMVNQLIRGTIREFHFQRRAREEGVELVPSENMTGRQVHKIDYVLKNGKTIQVKGLTRGLGGNGFLVCETQCSHGRVPTRLYRTSDFDYLVIVIDPDLLPEEYCKEHSVDPAHYSYAVVPMSKLPVHPRSPEWDEPRIKSTFKFRPEEVNINGFDLLKS